MRLYITSAVAAASAVLILVSGCGRAQALESFQLEEQDHLIAEAPGCYADCRVTGLRRTCMVREFDCRVVCKTLPECRPAGRPVKVCAVVKTR